MANAITSDHDLEAARRQYEEDGATVLRGVVPRHWIDRIAEATDSVMKDPDTGMIAHEFSQEDQGRFFGDVFSTLRVPEYKAFVHEAGLAEIAAYLMRSNEVRFFYDQLLVKEPNTPKRTPWHQDWPYWPVKGNQILSLWVPMDAATPETGVVTYVKGSHRWQAYIPQSNWAAEDPENDEDYMPFEGELPAQAGVGATEKQKRTLADIRDHPENYELLTWSVEPGDVVVHHGAAIHSAPGNTSLTMRRRALSTRWLGDDVRWDETRPHFMRMLQGFPDFPYPDLDTDDVVDAPLFPKLWPA